MVFEELVPNGGVDPTKNASEGSDEETKDDARTRGFSCCANREMESCLEGTNEVDRPRKHKLDANISIWWCSA